MAREREDPALAYVREAVDRSERQVAALERRRAVSELRSAFASYMATFLERRREFQTDLSDERRDSIRNEYRESHRRIRQAYRPLRDMFAEFLTEEPGYDQRHEVFDNGGHDLPLDYPFTNWWRALTFDEAYNQWSNADDDHISHYMRRQEAVLDAFEDWARVERALLAEDEPASPGQEIDTRQVAPGALSGVAVAAPARELGSFARALNHPWVVAFGSGAILLIVGLVLTLWLT